MLEALISKPINNLLQTTTRQTTTPIYRRFTSSRSIRVSPGTTTTSDYRRQLASGSRLPSAVQVRVTEPCAARRLRDPNHYPPSLPSSEYTRITGVNHPHSLTTTLAGWDTTQRHPPSTSNDLEGYRRRVPSEQSERKKGVGVSHYVPMY